MASLPLSVKNPLSSDPQPVQDSTTTSSALNIATNAVKIQASSPAQFLLSILPPPPVDGKNGPTVLLQTAGSESSMRFSAPSGAFHVGIGGVAGAGTAFITCARGPFAITIAQDGDVTITSNLTVLGSTTVVGQMQITNDLTVQGSLTANSLNVNTLLFQNLGSASDLNGKEGLKQLMVDPESGAVFYQ